MMSGIRLKDHTDVLVFQSGNRTGARSDGFLGDILSG